MKEIKTQVMAIVHGKSEFHLCNNIKSNLKIKHEIISKNKEKDGVNITKKSKTRKLIKIKCDIQIKENKFTYY